MTGNAWTNIFETYVTDRVALAVHVNLLGLAAISTWCVAKGIIWESSTNAAVKIVAERLVIWGVVAEMLCSVALFAFDEGISTALQERIAPRRVSLEQCFEIAKAVEPFRGKSIRVRTYATDAEGSTLGLQIAACLTAPKSVKVLSALASILPLGGFGSGVFVDGNEENKVFVEAISAALEKKANLVVSRGPGLFPGNQTSGDTSPVDASILVGVKPVPDIAIK